MAYTTTDLGEYAEALSQVQDFDQAYSVFEKQVLKLGFHGVLYSYIPKLLIESNFQKNPVFQMSEDYGGQYLAHYVEAGFTSVDPLLSLMCAGHKEPIRWWGDVSNSYMQANTESKEVLSASKIYGIHDGITIPLMFDERGIACASFTYREAKNFDLLAHESLPMLKICTQLFHNLVFTNSCHAKRFFTPIVDSLNATERVLLKGLAQGHSPGQIAFELGRSEKYLEQVMLRLRRKLAFCSEGEPLSLNRNQILYYTGLFNLLDHID